MKIISIFVFAIVLAVFSFAVISTAGDDHKSCCATMKAADCCKENAECCKGEAECCKAAEGCCKEGKACCTDKDCCKEDKGCCAGKETNCKHNAPNN